MFRGEDVFLEKAESICRGAARDEQIPVFPAKIPKRVEVDDITDAARIGFVPCGLQQPLLNPSAYLAEFESQVLTNLAQAHRVFAESCILLPIKKVVDPFPFSGGKPERIVDLNGFRFTGAVYVWMGLDPTDTPMLLRDVGTDDIYALTLEVK